MAKSSVKSVEKTSEGKVKEEEKLNIQPKDSCAPSAPNPPGQDLETTKKTMFSPPRSSPVKAKNSRRTVNKREVKLQ